jgi:hypothetical protein
MNCKNCEAPLTGKFCVNCGQKKDIHPITLKHVLHDFIHAFTHADKGFLLLIKELLVRPGVVAREYIEGKRKKYFNPLSFLVITMAVSAYLSFKSGYFESFANNPKNETEQSQPQNSPMDKRQLSQFDLIRLEAYKIIINDGKVIGLVLITPLISVLGWIFFRKPKRGIAEHFVLQSYLFGLSNVFRVVIIIPLFLVLPWDVRIIDNIFQVVFLFYLIVGYKQFFNNNLIWTIVKAILIFALFIVLFWYSIYGFVYVKHQIMNLFI